MLTSWLLYKNEQKCGGQLLFRIDINRIPYIEIEERNHCWDICSLLENILLKFVPRNYKEKAKTLLQIFDDRPNELTWDNSGVIWIDQVAIPNSNIYSLFPYLFRRKIPKDVLAKGFQDFVQKLNQMNLGHLLNCKKISENPIIPNASSNRKPTKWWYLN